MKKKARSRSSWHVYLVRCSDASLYCGVTNGLDARIAAHSAGRGAKYTRARGPVVLVWSMKCRSKSHALKVEYAIKSLTRTQKDLLVQSGARFLLRHSKGEQ